MPMPNRMLLLLLFLQSFVLHSPLYAQDAEEKASDRAEELSNAGKYEETVAFCEEKIKAMTLNNAADSLEHGMLHYYQGISYYYLEEYEESVKTYNRALPFVPHNQEGIEQKGIFLYERSFSEDNLGRPLKSFKTVQEAIATLETMQSPNLDFLLGAYNTSANDGATLGYYDQSLLLNQKALRLYEEYQEEIDAQTSNRYDLQLRRGRAYILKNRIYTEYTPEDGRELFHLTREMESIASKRKAPLTDREKLYLADAYNSYADHFLQRNENHVTVEESDSAILYLKKALNTVNKNTFEGNQIVFKYNLAKAHREKKEYAKALSIVEELLNAVDKDSYNYSAFLSTKSDLLFKMGQQSEALELIDELVKSVHDSDEELESDYSNFSPSEDLWASGLFLDIRDELDELPQTKKVSQLKQTLSSLAFQQLKHCHQQPGFNRLLKEYYIRSIYGQLHYFDREHENATKKMQALLNDTENIENRLAWQQFNRSREVVQLPVIDSLENVEYELRKQLVAAKKQRETKRQDSLYHALLTHKNGIEEQYPKLANFTQNNFNVTAFQKHIVANEIVLKYLFFKDEFVVFQITKDGMIWELKPWTPKEQKLLAQHLEIIKDPLDELSIGEQLTQALLPQKALNFQQLTIIPDSPIYNLPFETLVHKKQYLIENKAIRYSSHLRFAFFDKNNDGQPSSVTIFAPNYPEGDTTHLTRSGNYYLGGAEKEANVLAKLFPSKAFIGDNATKTNFISNKSSGNILHMAMHATIDKLNPEFSTFDFANGNQLSLEELYALKIPADLAVLSACNTGVGQEDYSSGLVSLQRAFNFAGTKATIASLWEVPDQTTSEIMIHFYQQLKRGKTKSQALQHAKINYLKTTQDPYLKHPYYWAGFVLYGDDLPVAKPGPNKLWYLFGGLLLLLALGFFIGEKTKFRAKRYSK